MDDYLTFEQTDDGRALLVGEWLPEVTFANEFLWKASPHLVHVDGTEVFLTLDNANAHYTITERSLELDQVKATLVAGVKSL
jgi:hypothetical protein